MEQRRVALGIAGAAVAALLVFVAYALSGADLCLWCPLLGR
jgi:hypothetical protein